MTASDFTPMHPPARQETGGRPAAGNAAVQPFHQGQLDVFCAVYAVVNALRSVHPVGIGQGRRLFNEVVLDLARDEAALRAVLYNATDHDALARTVLDHARREVAELRVVRPFARAPALRVTGRAESRAANGRRHTRRCGHVPDAVAQPVPREVWDALAGWLAGGRARAAVLRLHRYLPFRGDPVVSHWTAAGHLCGDLMALYDSSREPGAIHSVERDGFVTAPEHLSDDRLLLVEPRCLYLLEVTG